MNIEESTALYRQRQDSKLGVTTTFQLDEEDPPEGRRRQQEQLLFHYHKPSEWYGSTACIHSSSTDSYGIAHLDDDNVVIDADTDEDIVVRAIDDGAASVSQRRGSIPELTSFSPTFGRPKYRRLLWTLFGTMVGIFIVGMVSVRWLRFTTNPRRSSPYSDTDGMSLIALDDIVVHPHDHNNLNAMNASSIPARNRTNVGHITSTFSPFFDTVLPWTETEGGLMVGALEFCSDRNQTYSYGLVGTCIPGQPAPLIRMLPEERYQLTLVNTAHVDTNLHTHGLHVSGVGTVDDVTRNVEPGGCLIYDYYIVDDASVGTFWYHPHRHPLVSSEVYGGAYGMLIVDEVDRMFQNYYPPHLVNFLRSHEVLLQFSSFRDQDNNSIRTNKVNGRDHLDLVLDRDVHYYFRISSVVYIESVNYVEFTPTDACQSIRPIAYDGVYRSTIPHPNSSYIHMMTVSSRLDLAVQCSKDVNIHFHQGTMTDHSHLVTITMPTTIQDMKVEGDNDKTAFAKPTNTTTTARYSNYSVTMSSILPSSPYWDLDDGDSQLPSLTGETVQSSLLFWKPRRPYYYPNLTAVGTDDIVDNDDEIWTVSMDDYFTNGTKAVSVNQMIWDPMTPIKTYHLNQLVEWRIMYSDTHPFHTHVSHMQIVQPGGCGYRYEEGEYYDTITAEAGNNTDTYDHRGGCRIRIQFFDYAGRYVIHCHRLGHEDKGMMTWIDVIGGPGHGVVGTP
jgi:FtsP/CotA-like multicopper oxidase with cupredoxin domain